MRNRIGRLLAWVVTLGLLVYVLSSISPSALLAAVRSAAPWTVPAMAVVIVVVYIADCLAIWKTFGWFLARLSFREVLVVRGATYLLGLINYALGQGAMVYFVHRSRGVPVMKGAGAVLLIMGVNVLLLLVLASLGLVVSPEVPRGLGMLVAVAYAGLAIYLVALAVRPRWLTSRPIFDVLLGAGLVGHLKAIAVRVPHLVSVLVMSYVSLWAFGVRVPIAQAVLCLPVVYFIAVLPISVQGLGTTQVAMVHFFARYAAGSPPVAKATIVASSLTAQGVALVVQALIGIACLRSQMARDLPAPSSS